jgi:hypothetical protein
VGKKDALKAWGKIPVTPKMLRTMQAAIQRQFTASDDLTKIPHPATWLNAERWTDDVVARSISPELRKRIGPDYSGPQYRGCEDDGPPNETYDECVARMRICCPELMDALAIGEKRDP